MTRGKIMSTLAADTLHKTLRRQEPTEIAATVPPFPVIESPELKAQLSKGQYEVVQQYLEALVKFVRDSGKAVSTITIAFSKDKDLPDDIWFAIYMDAEGDVRMTFWDQVAEAQEAWLETQHELIKEFIYEHFVTVVRDKRYAV